MLNLYHSTNYNLLHWLNQKQAIVVDNVAELGNRPGMNQPHRVEIIPRQPYSHL